MLPKQAWNSSSSSLSLHAQFAVRDVDSRRSWVCVRMWDIWDISVYSSEFCYNLEGLLKGTLE
jgi:hypothetical protein